MNSNEDSQTPRLNSSRPIVLKIQGIGNCPSFKNSKMLSRGKLITDPEKQKWMERAIRAIESQLISLSQTIGGETLTELQQRSLIASFMPEDDSWQLVPEIKIVGHKTDKDSEGATITIEKIQ